tara:strand:+ start:9504 stop:10613 length:1110 start_codon:yes stop_codon:yes gene_type:complete
MATEDNEKLVARGGMIVTDESGNTFEITPFGVVQDYTFLAQTGQKEEITGSSITGYGPSARYVASESIVCGQPLARKIESSTGKTYAVLATTSSATNEFLGISLETASLDDTILVLTSGNTTVAFNTGSAAPSVIKLDDDTTESEINLAAGQTILFTDSGGTGSDYAAGETYEILFDALSGNSVELSFDSMSFEHSTYSMYDRLGFTTSANGISFANVSYSWMQASDDSTPAWDSDFLGGVAWNSAQASPGYVLPRDLTRANSMPLGGYSGSNYFYDTGARYVKFYFTSDGSSQRSGWQIQVRSSNASTNPLAQVGAKIYVGPFKGTNLPEGTALSETKFGLEAPFGTILDPDASSGSVFANIDFNPQA